MAAQIKAAQHVGEALSQKDLRRSEGSEAAPKNKGRPKSENKGLPLILQEGRLRRVSCSAKVEG